MTRPFLVFRSYFLNFQGSVENRGKVGMRGRCGRNKRHGVNGRTREIIGTKGASISSRPFSLSTTVSETRQPGVNITDGGGDLHGDLEDFPLFRASSPNHHHVPGLPMPVVETNEQCCGFSTDKLQYCLCISTSSWHIWQNTHLSTIIFDGYWLLIRIILKLPNLTSNG